MPGAIKVGSIIVKCQIIPERIIILYDLRIKYLKYQVEVPAKAKYVTYPTK